MLLYLVLAVTTPSPAHANVGVLVGACSDDAYDSLKRRLQDKEASLIDIARECQYRRFQDMPVDEWSTVGQLAVNEQ
jgi:hypothetical protein